MSTRIHSFKVDVTPPVGDYLCGGLHGPSTAVEDPIYMRGVVIAQEQQRFVLAAVDFTWLCARSYHRVIETLASAAETDPRYVTVHTVHQHDAPLIDEETHAIVEREAGISLHNEGYFASVLGDVDTHVRAAMSQEGRAVAYMAATASWVKEFASNRRLPTADGLVLRGSKCQNPEAKSLPIGKIDSNLRMVAFYDESESLLATLSFYASHPQVADGRSLISPDAPGFALRRLEAAHPNACHIYFTGCGADITNGKFAGPDRTADIAVFGGRLFDAMIRCLEQPELMPVPKFSWHETSVDLRFQDLDESTASLKAILRDPQGAVNRKYWKARRLLLNEQGITRYPWRISRLRWPGGCIFFVPAETLVGYQMELVERLKPEFCALAAYGDSFSGYIPQASDFPHGNYEIDGAWGFMTPACEATIMAGFEELLSEC